MIETENGAWPENTITAEGGSSTSSHIDQSVNKALPWFAALAMLTIVTAMMSAAAIVWAMSANQRLSDKISADAQVQTANNQTINDLRDRVIDAEKEARLSQNYLKIIDVILGKHGLTEQGFDYEQFKRSTSRGK